MSIPMLIGVCAIVFIVSAVLHIATVRIAYKVLENLDLRPPSGKSYSRYPMSYEEFAADALLVSIMGIVIQYFVAFQPANAEIGLVLRINAPLVVAALAPSALCAVILALIFSVRATCFMGCLLFSGTVAATDWVYSAVIGFVDSVLARMSAAFESYGAALKDAWNSQQPGRLRKLKDLIVNPIQASWAAWRKHG